MKARIRRKILAKRNSLSEEELTEKSKKIQEYLFALEEFKKAKTIMFYISIKKEVKTLEMIKQAMEIKKIFVPFIINNEIRLSELKDISSLRLGAFNIPEPVNKIPAKENIDLAVVPGIAFDKKGNRIGHGFGYYDRFLKDRKITTIALAVDKQIVKDILADKWDVPVKKIITEHGVINCG